MDKTKSRMAAQEMKDLEKMRKKEKELYREGAKTVGKTTALSSMAKNIIDPDEPTEKEKEMMRQMLREKKMDEGTNRGANQYKDTRILEEKAKGGMVPGYSKGGSVSKGNGVAIRGIRKCKMC